MSTKEDIVMKKGKHKLKRIFQTSLGRFDDWCRLNFDHLLVELCQDTLARICLLAVHGLRVLCLALQLLSRGRADNHDPTWAKSLTPLYMTTSTLILQFLLS